MRKHLHKLLFNIIFVVIFCLTVGCPQEGGVNMFVGVGRNVDETPPVITVTSPIDGSYLGERDLTISGTASDNVGVTKVSIEMKDMSTGDTLISGTNCNSMTSGVWEVVFTYSELNKINLFSNADSKQVYFRITAYDAMMNEAFTSLLLRVDTDAPTATWSRPATSTRFKDAEHNTFVLNRAEFDMKYSMDKTDTIGYFHNGVEQFSGFVDDNSKAAQTYLRFYKSDAAGHSILAAVTPVIKGTVTDDNSNDVNIVGRAPELSDTASAVQEIGTPVVSASPASWKYDIDTNALSELDGDDGWYRVVIATRDGADNTCDQLDSPEWILINQDADMPRNKFNIRKGVSINVNGQVSGIAFDDDGVSAVYIAAIPDNSDDIKALTDKSPTEWMPDDCTDDVYTTETAVYARILAADTDNGAPTLNWSITVPITGIGYRLFAVPVDINDLSEDKYADAAFDGLYHTTFRVASIEDPVISLTTRIVDMTSDTAVIRGYFYDNKAVTKIEASMSSYMTLGGEVKSDVSVDIYNGTETAKFIITDTTIDTLSTGQKVTKYFFNWIFSPSVFVPDLGYSSMEILLKVYDDEGRYGNDTLNVYGDSERPMFDRISPPNNSTITEDVTFDGWIYDNIGITELRLYCKGLTSQFAERKWGLGGVNDLSVDNESVLYDGTTDTLRGKYGRHFSTIITPSQIGYGTPLVVIEAKDKAGNTNEYQINIKGDTKSPEVAFPGMNSGLLMNETSSFPIRVLPVINDKSKGLYRPIDSVTLTLKDENNTTGKTIDGWTWIEDESAHVKTYEMSSFTHQSSVYPFAYDMTVDLADLNIVNYGMTDINITVTAKDVSENEGKATLYFIIDKQGPNIQLTPINGASVYGTTKSNQVRGTVNDRSNIKSIVIAITGSDTAPSASDTSVDIIDYIFKEPEDVSNIAEFTLVTKGVSNDPADNPVGEYYLPIYNEIYNGGADFTFGSKRIIHVTPSDGVQPMYIWAKGVDVLGNEGAWSCLTLNVNPHADRPQTVLDYPEDDAQGNHATVGGTVRISGSTNIADTNVGVGAVFIQIDPDYVGEFAADWEDKLVGVTGLHGVKNFTEVITDASPDMRGIEATGTKSWSYMINSLREFNKTDGGGNKINRTMAVRAISVSNSGKVSNTAEVVFILDPNAPVFGDTKSLRVEDKDNDTVYKLYNEKMWIVAGQTQKQWQLAGDIFDEDGISDLTLTYTINNVRDNLGYLIKGGVIQKPDWVSENQIPAANGHKNYFFHIPIIMDDVAAGTQGTVEIALEAFEFTDDKKSATQNCIINYDMQEPVLNITGYWEDKADNYTAKITQPTENGADFISLKGTVSESGTQSGFASVAVQATRTLGGKTYVIDPMISKGSGDANRHQVSGDGAESDWTQIAGLWCHKMSGVTVNDAMLTLPTAPNDSNIRLNSLCFINDMPYLITEVNNSTKVLTISGTPAAGSGDVYFAMAQIIDNQKSEDTDTLPAVFDYAVPDSWGDGDQMKESVKDNIGFCSWTALINSWNIFDGSTDFIFTAFDKADNWTTVTKYAKIANNEPRLAGVSFGCDDNGDGTFSGTEMKDTFSGWYNVDSANKKTGITENGKNEKLEIITSFSCPANIEGGYVFVVKDDIKIVPEIVGGNGNLSWKLYHQATLDGSKTLIAEADTTSAGNQTDVRTFDVNVSKETLRSVITSDIENEYLLLEISDSTAGSPNVSAIIIKTATLLHDTKAPSAAIDEFYWNDKTDNSVYKDADGNLQGHIELTDDLPSDYFSDSNSFEFDLDPKVSGKVIFAGAAVDNVIVNGLHFHITGYNGDVTVDIERAEGSFADADLMPSTGYMFHVVSDTFDASTGANTVVWQFIWDSEKIDTVAKTDVIVTVTASDAVGNTGVGDTDTYQIDVVPYITGVETALSKLKAKNPSVYNRTALGHYPVNGGKPSNANNTSTLTAETVTFLGYNLGDEVELDISSLESSGQYDFTVNGVKALNNYNNNNAKGAYGETTTSPTGDYAVYSNYYNRQPNNDNNNLLTDDVYFDVWGINPMAVQPINGVTSQPVMAINPNNHDVGFAFVNGALYYSMPNGSTYSYDNFIGGFDYWTSVTMAYDSLGNSYGVAAGGDINETKADQFRIMTSRWGYADRHAGGYNTATNNLRLELIGQYDYMYNGTSYEGFRNFDKERIRSPSLAAGTASDDATSVYLAYYDAINDEIRFKWGEIKTTKDKTWKNLSDADKIASFFGDYYGVSGSEAGDKVLDNGKDYSKYRLVHNSWLAGQTSRVYNTSGETRDAQVITTAGNSVYAGQYVSIAAIPGEGTAGDDAVVAVWWDGFNNQLLYSYNLTPKSIAVGKYAQADTKWSTPVQIFDPNIGEYCKVAVIKETNNQYSVHIVGYDGLNCDVWYAYIPNFKSTSNIRTCLVDSYGLVGTEMNIDVALDSSGVSIPYISYYAGSCAHPKVAYWAGTVSIADADSLDGVGSNESFTNLWEVSVIPTQSRVSVDYVNIGVWKNSSGTLNWSTTDGAAPQSDNSNIGETKLNYKEVFNSGGNTGYKTGGHVYGNGTRNPILGYAITSGANGYIETAQMR